jgi:hypothetical protein
VPCEASKDGEWKIWYGSTNSLSAILDFFILKSANSFLDHWIEKFSGYFVLKCKLFLWLLNRKVQLFFWSKYFFFWLWNRKALWLFCLDVQTFLDHWIEKFSCYYFWSDYFFWVMEQKRSIVIIFWSDYFFLGHWTEEIYSYYFWSDYFFWVME